MIKKCPFCGADIEESARFCLYCMQSLIEKEQLFPLPQKAPKRKLLPIFAFTMILTIVCSGGQLALQMATSPPKPSVTNSAHTPAAAVTNSAHTPVAAVTENYVAPSCTKKGSYDEVVYCSVCREELSRTQKTVDKTSHTFNQKRTSSHYLKSPASCMTPAIYYYSCACGTKGTNTFENGPLAPHVFDQKNTDPSYLKDPASCTEPATYYYSCACGIMGDTAFAHEESLRHTFSSTWDWNEDYHWHPATCEHVSEISDYSPHVYGENGEDNFCSFCGRETHVSVREIHLNYDSLTMAVGDTETLIATITPPNATEQGVTYRVSDPSIVTVDADGTVTAVGVGTANISVCSDESILVKATCTVTVNPKPSPTP